MSPARHEREDGWPGRGPGGVRPARAGPGRAASRLDATDVTQDTPSLVWMAPVPWDGIPGSDRQLALAMTRHARVLWVDPPVSALTPARVGGEVGGGLLPSLSEAADRITRLTTVALPGLSRPGIRATTAPLQRAQVRWALRKLGIRPAAVVAGNTEDVLGRQAGAVNVLYCTDDLVAGAALMGLSAARLEAQDRRALARADVVVVVSPTLAGRWAALGAAPVLIPNGCAADRPAAPVPAPAAAGLPRPVAGLVGQLSDRIDMAILEALSEAGFGQLIVGPHDQRWEPRRFAALTARPGVHHAGRVAGDAVPAYLAAIDVGVTPYADSAFNRASFPLKTLEYLAAGRPVVSTDLPGARWLLADLASVDPAPEQVLSLARGPAEMVAAVRRMTAQPGGPGLAARCRSFAARHSWARRADALAAAIGLAPGLDAAPGAGAAPAAGSGPAPGPAAGPAPAAAPQAGPEGKTGITENAADLAR